MKNLIILLFVFASICSHAQIVIPKDTIKINMSHIVLDLGHYNIRYLGDVVNDSVMMQTTAYPPFVELDLVDAVFNAMAYKNDTTINGIDYHPLRDPIFKLWRSGKITVCQKVLRSTKGLADKPKDIQKWIYLDKAYELKVSPDVLWNFPAVVKLDEVAVIPQKDSI